MRTRLGTGLAAAALLLSMVGVGTAADSVTLADDGADEYRVKAAILYNLAKFVDWPADAFGAATAPMHVCVLGVDPFGAAIDEAFKGHQVGGRSVVVRRITQVDLACHVVFIASSEKKRIAMIEDRLKSASILTVSEGDGSGEAGGMIELFTEGDRVRFNINVGALEAARLRASARLREIASNEKRSRGARR